MPKPYARGKVLWFRYKDPQRGWSDRQCGDPAAPYRVGQEDLAQRFINAFVAGLAAAATPGGPMTLARYVDDWIARRRKLGYASVNDEATRLRLHVVPRLGGELLVAIKPKHVAALILELRAAGALAPRTIHHVAGTLHALFASARREELVEHNPVDLERGVLPKKTDKDPSWRRQAIYARSELELLIGDHRIPEARRVLYALKGLGMLRHGEAARLRWREYDTAAAPLGRIDLDVTKSKVPRAVPAHKVLAAILAEWRLAGWPKMIGRPPTEDDLIVPTKLGTVRKPAEAQVQLLDDLRTLGLRVEAGAERNRRGHDLRRTVITLLQVDGARRDLIETISHGPRGDIVSVYTTIPWPALCGEVAKLKVRRRAAGDVVKLREGA